MGCATGCLKWVLIITNTIFFLGGAAALGLGIWLALDEEAFEILGITNPGADMDYLLWKITIYTFIGVGAFIFFIAGIGMAGACCKNRCLLLTYSILGAVALAGELACAVLALVYADDINAEVAATMKYDLTRDYTYPEDIDNPYVSTWDNFQTMMSCCGSYNHTDWWENKHYNDSDSSIPVPWTCCNMYEVDDPPQYDDVRDVDMCYQEGRFPVTNIDKATELQPIGCHQALVVWVDDNSIIIYGVMFGLMGLQILTMTFSCMLYCAYDRNDEKRYV